MSEKKSAAPVPGLPARLAAARLLSAVIDKKTSLDGLIDNEHGHPQYLALEMRDRMLVRAILGAALRHRADIERIFKCYLDRPLPQNALSLRHLLHVAAAQVLYLDVPDHAAIDLAVTAAKSDPRNQRFSGLVNAILRKLARTADEERAQSATTENIPAWFSQVLVENYGREKAAKILAAQANEPPIDISVKSNPEMWAEKLGGHVLFNGTVRLEHVEGAVSDLEGYQQGEWWVQDAAASLPARLLGNIKDKTVADLCAAPGGKTAELAIQGANVTAIDLSANRLKRLQHNMERLNLKVATWAGNLKDFKPEELFDAVLLDAPCSSTGTIRRHPDILWTKDVSDVEKLAKLQLELLIASISLVKIGGLIVFANCSIFRQEGEELVNNVLSSRNDIKLVPIRDEEVGGRKELLSNGVLRTTPADLEGKTALLSGMDGFFAARFQRIA
ncbi:RsmB/NOP family class I SAM-dependent RNA methyltransferase [uncultured Bartonella sp.]|uniref:RsmB/NOP family class I SAM-dependent RNA methyltransferase n=1 Tax=uncultured Bartonella sp. TaxID=104108 RepID=UPI0025D9CC8D|nr:RsmB/NOP family class I SAM-dependent RNA methyltransferase [uncultured Bartonella sp.]